MGFFDSLGRSVKGALGMDNSAMQDAADAAAKQAAEAEAERKKIQDKEDAEKKKLQDKQMRSLKRKFGGSGGTESDGMTTKLGS